MRLISRKVLVTAALSWAMAAVLATPPAAKAQGSGASQQDKAKTCNDLADKKGLTGADKKTFLQNCINKTTDAKPPSEMSQKEKADACKNLADKRNLTGADRRSFLKDCMNKANPK